MLNIEQILRKYLMENNLSFHYFWLIYSYADSIIRDFNLDLVGQSRVFEFSGECTFAEDDEISYITDVGYLNAGNFIPFERSKVLSVTAFAKAETNVSTTAYFHIKHNEDGFTVRNVDMTVARTSYLGHPTDIIGSSSTDRIINRYSENTGGYYGASLDNKNYWNLDFETKDVAILADRYKDNLAIKYMVDSGNISLSTVLHPYSYNFVVAALRYYHADRSRGATNYAKATSKAQFEEEYGKYRSRIMAIGPETIKQVLRRAHKSVPKP